MELALSFTYYFGMLKLQNGNASLVCSIMFGLLSIFALRSAWYVGVEIGHVLAPSPSHLIPLDAVQGSILIFLQLILTLVMWKGYFWV